MENAECRMQNGEWKMGNANCSGAIYRVEPTTAINSTPHPQPLSRGCLIIERIPTEEPEPRRGSVIMPHPNRIPSQPRMGRHYPSPRVNGNPQIPLGMTYL